MPIQLLPMEESDIDAHIDIMWAAFGPDLLSIFYPGGDTQVRSSTWIKEADLDINNEGFPQQFVLAKNESAPSVNGGALWADEANKIIYQYGGEYNNGQPEDFKLWYYDIPYNTWNVSGADTSDIRRASWGGSAVAQDRGLAFYYGGYTKNTSVPGYGRWMPLSNMLVYDMLGSTFRNMSGPDGTHRAEGVMLYVPAGDAGLLVYFGGLFFEEGNATDWENRGMNMSEIHVYSIGDDLWYKETATGQVPEPRRRFCAGLAMAEDRSSYNIYLFGGAAIESGVGYGDVYVLSLPSFTWIKFWPRPEDNVGATFPHHSLTCDVIGNSQMIIQGGHFPNLTNECDVPRIYGQHGLDLGKANPEGAKWAAFNPNLTTYQVPPEITGTIGGGPTGGATVLAPTAGWQQRDLSVQFDRKYTPATRKPTRYIPPPTSTNEPDSDDNKGAVIGGAVGGAVGGLLLVAAIAFCVFYRRKKAKDASGRPPSELPTNAANMKSPNTPTQHRSPFFPHTPENSPPPPPMSESGWDHNDHWDHRSPAPAYTGHSPHSAHPSHPSYMKHHPLQQPQELAGDGLQEMEGQTVGLGIAKPPSPPPHHLPPRPPPDLRPSSIQNTPIEPYYVRRQPTEDEPLSSYGSAPPRREDDRNFF